MNNKKKFLLFVLFILVSLVVAVLSSYLGLDQETIQGFVALNKTFASLIYTVLFIVLASFSFSVSVMTSVGTLFFSGPEAVAYAIIGIMGSAMVHFYIARRLGRDYVRETIRKRGGVLEKFDEIVEKNTFKTILILSAVFFVPPTVVNLLGGVVKINTRKYALATLFGNFPNTLFTVYLMKGLLYTDALLIGVSLAGLILTTLIALYFYTGELKHILRLSFPWAFKKSGK